MHLNLAIHQCQYCDPPCGMWMNLPRDIPKDSHIFAGTTAKEGYLVMSDTLPTPETGHFPVSENGIIPGWVDSVCPDWQERIRRMFNAGYRYIYFALEKPEGSEDYFDGLFNPYTPTGGDVHPDESPRPAPASDPDDEDDDEEEDEDEDEDDDR